MSVYNKVAIRKPGRNVFNLSHSYKGSLNIGELVPIARPMETVPGDTFITGNITKVELNPIVTNFNGELFFETWQFFVSNDMLYRASDSGKFTEILASMQNPTQILPLPTYNFTPAQNAYPRSYFNLLSGCPVGVNTGHLNIVAYPFRGVDLIVDEWFKDENLEPNPYNSSTYTLIHNLYNINYKKDRFTSAFLSTQKGVTLRMKEVFNPVNTIDLLKPTSVSPAFSIDGLSTDGGTNTINGIVTGISTANINSRNDEFNNLVASYLNSAFQGFTINDLRLYNKLQKWLERNQLCGTRLKEYLLSNYGVTPNDETLQRPVLIGHTKIPVIIDEIMSNIKASNGSGTFANYQGSRGGAGSANSSFKYGKWFCKEFGWILTFGALRPKAVYTGGIHKSLTRDSVIDYFNPIFEHLGQQPIYNKELHIQGTSAVDNDLFGYQDIYNELRHLEDFISGDLLAVGFQQKNIFRAFGSTPTLSRTFIEVKPTDYDYLFAVPSTTAPQAFFNSSNIVKAVRPISKRSMPSL